MLLEWYRIVFHWLQSTGEKFKWIFQKLGFEKFEKQSRILTILYAKFYSASLPVSRVADFDGWFWYSRFCRPPRFLVCLKHLIDYWQWHSASFVFVPYFICFCVSLPRFATGKHCWPDFAICHRLVHKVSCSYALYSCTHATVSEFWLFYIGVYCAIRVAYRCARNKYKYVRPS